jgi:hypothetical protein
VDSFSSALFPVGEGPELFEKIFAEAGDWGVGVFNYWDRHHR